MNVEPVLSDRLSPNSPQSPVQMIWTLTVLFFYGFRAAQEVASLVLLAPVALLLWIVSLQP